MEHLRIIHRIRKAGCATIESDECQKHWLASGCLALEGSDDEGDIEPQQQGEGEDIESNSEPAIILVK